MNGFLIAAATSNSGKTTFTIGLLRALRNRGICVQPYKCGPDYIDTMFHELASGRESVNLDTFMSSKEHVMGLYQQYGCDADCCIVEGVMGMYDGYDKWHGSSAEIASLLQLPVILVVNAKSAAYSVAPLIYGFKNFMAREQEMYVVFNNVASETHYAHLRVACDDAGAVCLGYIPRNSSLVIPGRHLGLTISAREETERIINIAAEEIEKHVNIDLLIKHNNNSPYKKSINEKSTNTIIAIAKDEAFNFVYRANIDALCSIGEVQFFSPLRDSVMPHCDVLYLPGGYPELFADELSANASMRNSIRQYAENGGRVYAECGGFMYLCNGIDGTEMCGVLPLNVTMQGAHLHLGYREMEGGMRGHEFHYSSVIEPETLPEGLTAERRQTSAKGNSVDTAIYHYNNVTAGYTHWYWAENLDIWKNISNFAPRNSVNP